jgi:phosphoglycerate dehydrogenase-like enzyme
VPLGVLLTQAFYQDYGRELQETAERAGIEVEPVLLEQCVAADYDAELLARVNLAFFSSDLIRNRGSGFHEAVVVAPNLQWFHLCGVGVDRARYGALLDRGVRITNSIGVNNEPIALNAVTGLLVLAREFPHWLQAQQERIWRPIDWDSPILPLDLAGQTMVLVGVGAVGSRIAEFARLLRMHVVGVRRSPHSGEAVDEMVHPKELDRVLKDADWLVLACTLTDETRGLIDARRLALLKRGARFVNISRGAVVVEEDLIEALKSGQLRGAYMDVFAKEPLPAESPLWDMPNVVITPHNAAISSGKYRREADLFFQNLRRWSRGQPMLNEVAL